MSLLREARPLLRKAGLQLPVNGFLDCEPLYVLRVGVDDKELHIGEINLRERLAVGAVALSHKDRIVQPGLVEAAVILRHGAVGVVALGHKERVRQPVASSLPAGGEPATTQVDCTANGDESIATDAAGLIHDHIANGRIRSEALCSKRLLDNQQSSPQMFAAMSSVASQGSPSP